MKFKKLKCNRFQFNPDMSQVEASSIEAHYGAVSVCFYPILRQKFAEMCKALQRETVPINTMATALCFLAQKIQRVNGGL